MNKSRDLNGIANIERIVGKYFIRVIKNHNNYGTFKKTFDNISKRNGDRENPFGRCRDYNDFLAKLNNFTKSDFDAHAKEGTQYEYVTMMINHLLHHFLEKGGVHPSKLGQYGQEIFDLSCYSAFGDAFLRDMEKMNKSMGVDPRGLDDAQLRLMHEYISRKKNGEEMTYEEFMQHYHPDFMNETEQPQPTSNEEENWWLQSDVDEDFYNEEDYEENEPW